MRHCFRFMLYNFSKCVYFNNSNKFNFYNSFSVLNLRLVSSSAANGCQSLHNYEKALQPYTDEDISDITNVEEFKNKEDILAECNEDVSMYTPYYSPSFNLASYVNKSPSLQELVKLGVNLHKLENKRGIAEAVLKLDFERDVKKYLIFLNALDIPPDQFGSILTKCPGLLFQDLENLQIRLNYLESKKFSPADIVRIVTKNPFWLTWKTQDIDFRLGFFQKNFKMNGNEVRFLAIKMPVIITHKLDEIKQNIFCFREEMGFSVPESKMILLKKPKVYKLFKSTLSSRFDYLHNIMKIPHSILVEQPDGLLHKRSRIEARHGFLHSLSRDQYDPTKPNYVSILALLTGTDAEFASNVAKTSIQTYNKYLKSL